jgi:autotransporter passenger strand-loop-strand repeat protein
VISGGGVQNVDAGTAYGTIICAGGIQVLSGYGAASGTIVSSGGIEVVGDYLRAAATDILAGGYVVLLPGASLTSATISGTVISTGIVLISPKSGLTRNPASAVLTAGMQDYVLSGGLARNTVVSNGGSQSVLAGVASGTLVSRGGVQSVEGGIASGAIIRSGGAQDIFYGAAYATVVSNGGEQIVSGGIAYNTVLRAGGAQLVSNGAAASGTSISSGGVQMITDYGSAVGTIISGGGQEVVTSFGFTSNTTIDGGVLVLRGGYASGAVTFSGSGGILVVSGAVPAAIISGFAAGDEINLATALYASNETVSVVSAGLVVISGGGISYNLDIAGATLGETGFIVSSGAGGGIILTQSTVSGAARMNFLRPTPTPSGDAALFAAPGIEESLGPKAAASLPAAATTSTAEATLRQTTPPIPSAGWAAFFHRQFPWG